MNHQGHLLSELERLWSIAHKHLTLVRNSKSIILHYRSFGYFAPEGIHVITYTSYMVDLEKKGSNGKKEIEKAIKGMKGYKMVNIRGLDSNFQ